MTDKRYCRDCEDPLPLDAYDDVERCDGCDYDYRINHDYYEALYSGHRPAAPWIDDEGMRARTPKWRGGTE